MANMQYRVVSKDVGDDAVAVDTIYTIDMSGNCWRMLDSDGDSIPDVCSLEKTNNCSEVGTYKTVECNYRRKNWFKIGSDRFSEYPNGNDLARKWKLGLVTRSGGVTTAKYSCGDGCQIDLYDSDSDGSVDEAFLAIYLYTVSFVGDMPYPAHEMLQRAVLTAFDHFLPGSFTKTLAVDTWEVGVLAFSRELSFAYNPYFAPGSSISFEGKPLTFAPDAKVAGEAVATAASAEEPKTAPSGDPHIFISESGGAMVDVTDDYYEYGPDDLGVVPLTSTEDDKSE